MSVKIQHLRLKSPWENFLPGDIVLAVFDERTNCWAMGKDNYSYHFFKEKELRKLGDPVSPEDAATYKEEILTPKPLPQLGLNDLLLGEAIEEISEEEPNEDRRLSTGINPMAGVRNKFLEVASKSRALADTVNRHKNVLTQNAAALKLRAEFESRGLVAQMEAARKQMEDLQDALDMVNLYLGSTEIVNPIRDGKKAPAETPISIRQRILFMDEECALLDTDGIDCHKISDFDSYVQHPELLEQILPEEKGVVVLRVCRNLRKYHGVDPFTQAHLDEENSKTYWLCRNGECLWRFWSDLELPEKLFPTQVLTVSKHAPGSRDYFDEMKHAEKTRRTFMKAGLLLQGLIDRTNIFAPYPEKKRPILTRPETWPGRLALLEDDAPALGEGKPKFEEWLRTMNGQLEEGQRVIVHRVDRDLVSPKNAEGFDKDEIFTVKKNGSRFYVSFKRTDDVYDGWRSRPSRGWGSLTLEMSSKDWINFDRAIPEEFDFYIRSRETRESYRTMIPLLRKTKALREEEAKAEAPFLALIESRATQKGAKSPKAMAKDLVAWWKTKIKTHRPLIGGEKENADAWKGISKEMDERILGEKTPECPIPEQAVLASRKSAKDIDIYLPTNLPFCTRESWHLARGTWTLQESLPNQRLPYTPQRNEILKINEDWVTKAKEFPKSHLPLETFMACDLQKTADDVHSKMAEPVAAILVEVAYTRQEAYAFMGGEGKKYQLHYKAGELHLASHPYHRGMDSTVSELLDKRNFVVGEIIENPYRKNIVLWTNDKVCEEMRGQNQKEQKDRAEKSADHDKIRKIIAALETQLETEWKNSQFMSFVNEGGDPGFFEDHLRTLLKPKFDTTPLERALDILHVGENIRPAKLKGKTWEEIKTMVEKANKTIKGWAGFDETLPWADSDKAAMFPNFLIP